MGAAREHGILDALNAAGVSAVADTAYRGGDRRSGFRSGDGGWIPTPVATGACRATRKRSMSPRQPGV